MEPSVAPIAPSYRAELALTGGQPGPCFYGVPTLSWAKDWSQMYWSNKWRESLNGEVAKPESIRPSPGGLKAGRVRAQRIKGLEEEVTPGVGGQWEQSSLQRYRGAWGPGAAWIRVKDE